ncbi:Aminoglycoside phosphotransferase [Penicillium herquei]|nr:Aminoglycoside phosphotransferase [Penicillium herquei]
MEPTDPKDQVPCLACTWTAERQRYCGYKSNLKLFYEAGDRGAWSLGSKFILKDRNVDPPIYEAVTTTFVKENTSIPLPGIAKEWTDGTRHFILVERVPGETLEKVWSKIPEEKREELAKETAEYLSQLRQFHSPKMQSVDRQPLHNAFLFGGDPDSLHGPFSMQDELWDAMVANFKDVPDEVAALWKERMPSPLLWTLAHADLTNCNIMVDPETFKLTAIIDWERSGYYPVWWEYAGATIAFGSDDAEWKGLLLKYMPDYSAALGWFRDVYNIRRGSYSDEESVEE